MTNKISSGSYDLNKWLFGGYDSDIITTTYGPAGSGKTNLCMLACVSQAKKGNKIIFIDTEGGFSTERFKQITGEGWKNFLENVLILKPTNFSEQDKSFIQLLKELKTKSNIGLIIVDGITMLYRLELAEAKKDIEKIKSVNSKLAHQLRILSEISRKQNIPVIITNQVYSDFIDFRNSDLSNIHIEKEVKMVGGDILKYWSKCIIELQNNSGKRKIILKKHRSLPQKEMNFEIVNQGIRKKGWL